MRKLFVLLLFVVCGFSATAQIAGSITTPTPIGGDIQVVQALRDIYLEFQNAGYSLQHSNTVADILSDGKVDTTYLDTNGGSWTYYGAYWVTTQADHFPRVTITGVDSADVEVSYRWIGYTSNVAGFGPWNVLGTLTLKSPPTARDSLVPGTGYLVYPADSTFKNNNSGIIQMRYKCKSLQAQYGAPYLHRNKRKITTAQKWMQQWRGEMELTWRRDYL